MPPLPESRKRAPSAEGSAPAVSPVQFLKGVGPAKARALRSLGVETPEDLLLLFPRAHEDRRREREIGSLRDGDAAVVRGRVASVSWQRIPGRRPPMTCVRVTIEDGTGPLVLEFWNQPWRRKDFAEGDEILAFGKVTWKRGLRMTSPSTDNPAKGDAEERALSWGRIVPVYPLARGLRQREVRRAVREALDRHLAGLEDPVPPAIAAREGLSPLREAVAAIHFPNAPGDVEAAKRRLMFDDVLLLQAGLALRRRDLARERRGFTYSLGPVLDRRIRRRFPFPFTAAQDRAVADILRDLAAPHPMNRLLQGDVGSGKTAVALYAMLAAVANRRQAALLAPTEILAEQHFRGFLRTLEGSRVRVELLAGRMPAKSRRALLAAVQEGEVGILVATHAVLEGDVAFRDLGVAVVDEQHRFGVHQRRDFREKGLRPDLLHLTATPIPRTLTLAFAGHLDVSVIDERPPGRRPVRTLAVGPGDEAAAHALVRKEAAAGRRAFFICPLVEESEASDLRAAKKEAERLRTKVFPDLKVGLLHGRMKGVEKNAVMEEFRRGRLQVLVSTVVVEVGVDVPEASVLAVLHAERFGLSQLHQLRGRIGRGPHESTCLLFTGTPGEEARRRIDAMVSTDDGFRIAEMDLAIRGPGEFFGARQSGLPDLRFPEAILDQALLARARGAAAALLEADPDLRRPEHRALREALRRRWGARLDLARV